MHSFARRALRTLPLLTLIVLAGACREEKAPTADVSGLVEPVIWHDVAPERAELADRVVHDFGLPADPADWHLDSPKVYVKQLAFQGEEGRADTLVLERADGGEENRWDIGLEGNFDPDSFNLLRLHLATEAGCRISARFYREGEVVYNSRGNPWVESSVAGTVVEIDMPELRFQGRPMEQLQLIVRSKGSMAIRSIQLVDRPIGNWLPSAAGGEELIHLGPLARSAVGLWSGSPIEADVDLTQPASLTFSYGVPGTLEYPVRKSMKLHVHATGADGTEVDKTIALPKRGEAPNQWNHVEVPLHTLHGERGKLRMELEVPDAAEGIYAIAEAKIVQHAQKPRTVILVTSDTHRYDHVGASHSGVQVSTPTLDALAARGVFFENCYTSTNVTNPSHVAIMTATHPRDTGILDNTSPLVRSALTLAETYQAAGYRTWAVLSAIHLGDHESGLGQGFDRVSIPNGADYDAHEALDTLLDWMPDADDAPLFVWLHLFDAHIPYAPPAPFDRKYYGDGDPFDPALPNGIPVPELPPSLHGLRDASYPPAQYRAEVDYLDSQLGRLMQLPRVQSGVVAVTADHGENLGQHGIYYDHGNLYPDSIHVPLVISWPGAPEGERVPAPVFQLDLGSTLLELSDTPAKGFPGTSMLHVLDGEENDVLPRFALGAHALSCSVNYGRWHLILHLREHAPGNFTQSHALHQVELYDLNVDPACEHDVVDEYPEDARRMRRLLIDWLESASETGWASEGRKDPETMERLRNLGYTTADGSDIQLLDPDCECPWCARFR
ncbi:MAG: sulfatase [Planctomycetes bacterium]|nr:sulfatase [Planctomycetota bacterium]MCB9904333.1 sulfatase [Planctomycetota bacterium]